jgi:hypothetical protein
VNRQGFAFCLFSVIFIVVALLSPLGLPHSIASQDMLALIYFLTLLTLINAPFDWVALGITRGLLRRGLELRGFAPLGLGLLDLMISIGLLVLLAIAVLWGTEAFNHFALLGGYKAPVDPAIMLPALLKEPAAYEHIWLYAMLFSTQIPALLNLMFGLFCLLRGWPPANRWMIAQLPATGDIGVWQRALIATTWSGQLGIAIFAGCTAFYYLYVYGLIWLGDALFGFTLIDALQSLSIAGWLAG